MAGIPVSTEELNVRTGDISRQVQIACNDVVEMKRYLDAFTADALVAKFPGLTLDDANLIKSAYGELQIVADAQAANRTFSSRIAGMGDV